MPGVGAGDVDVSNWSIHFQSNARTVFEELFESPQLLSLIVEEWDTERYTATRRGMGLLHAQHITNRYRSEALFSAVVYIYIYIQSRESLKNTCFDSLTPTGSHHFGLIYCLKEQHERKTASSHVRDFLSNTSTHAHWLRCRNSDFRLTSVNEKRLLLSSLVYSCTDGHLMATMFYQNYSRKWPMCVLKITPTEKKHWSVSAGPT